MLVAGPIPGARRCHFHSLPGPESLYIRGLFLRPTLQGTRVDDRPGNPGAGARKDSCPAWCLQAPCLEAFETSHLLPPLPVASPPCWTSLPAVATRVQAGGSRYITRKYGKLRDRFLLGLAASWGPGMFVPHPRR